MIYTRPRDQDLGRRLQKSQESKSQAQTNLLALNATIEAARAGRADARDDMVMLFLRTGLRVVPVTTMNNDHMVGPFCPGMVLPFQQRCPFRHGGPPDPAAGLALGYKNPALIHSLQLPPLPFSMLGPFSVRPLPPAWMMTRHVTFMHDFSFVRNRHFFGQISIVIQDNRHRI